MGKTTDIDFSLLKVVYFVLSGGSFVYTPTKTTFVERKYGIQLANESLNRFELFTKIAKINLHKEKQ